MCLGSCTKDFVFLERRIINDVSLKDRHRQRHRQRHRGREAEEAYAEA